ncbi:ParA family protein [Marinomonas sp. 2405UD68-3]|uniref:ParA family protein n=1 Tax=Marinomonas sp. 2405UD68-3 TaxID=3391835 RepID=UPI0039C9815C
MDALDVIESSANRLSMSQQNLKQFMSDHKKVKMFVGDEDLDIDRIHVNNALNKSQLARALNMRQHTLNAKIDRAISDNIIPQPLKQSIAHLFTRDHINALMEYMELPTYRSNKDPICIAVANQKGGIAKSTTTVTLGVAMALDLNLRAKILLIDLDPQGSSGTNLYNHAAQAGSSSNNDDLFLTGVDLILGEYEANSQNGEEYASAVNYFISEGATNLEAKIATALEATKPTHLPNLDVLPAFPSDERLTDIFGEMTLPQKEALFKHFNDIIDGIKQHYDIVIIDTPPQDAAFTWLGLDVANFILTPIKPSPFDVASSSNFLSNLRNRLEKLPSQGKNLRLWRSVITNHDSSSDDEVRIKLGLHRSLGANLYSSPIYKSVAFTAASALNRTIMDLKNADKVCSSRQLSSARDSFSAFYSQISADIESHFSKID